MKRSAIAAIALSLAGTATVWCQQDQPRQWEYPHTLGALRVANVQSELGLSDEQKAAVKQLEAEWLEVWKQLQKSRAGLSEKEFAEKQSESKKPFESKARDLLSEEQQEALRKIQRRGGAELLNPLRELLTQEMQKELALDEEQKQAIEGLHQEWIKEIDSLDGLSENTPVGQTWWESDFARAVFRVQREFKPRVRSLTKEILRGPQLARLHQIEWQTSCVSEGANVLVRSQVAEYLGLTEEQQKSIRALADEGGRKERELRREGEDDKQIIARREALHKALAQLSFLQRIRWNAMIGKPYRGYKWMFEESAKQEEKKTDGAN